MVELFIRYDQNNIAREFSVICLGYRTYFVRICGVKSLSCRGATVVKRLNLSIIYISNIFKNIAVIAIVVSTY